MARKILIVDDEVDLRDIMSDAFGLLGWEVYTAENGAVAMEVLEKVEGISVLISDVRMPVMDGTELLRSIKSKKFSYPRFFC